MPKKVKLPPKPGKEAPKRLTPTPDTLRELYLLSGNRCAMPECEHVLIDGNGVVVGVICHIRAAMPDGARFDKEMTNESRRHASNLVMMCGGHHTQIDSKAYETKFNLKRVTKIKKDHERKFRGIGDSLLAAFESEYTDLTGTLSPTDPATFSRFDKLLDEELDEEQQEERRTEIATYAERMRVVPENVRSFMLAVIERAQTLGYDPAVVPTDDLKGAVKGMTHSKLVKMRPLLEQYRLGDLDKSTVGGHEVDCVFIRDPSGYVSWHSLARYCELSGSRLEDFAINLKFGLLDS